MYEKGNGSFPTQKVWTVGTCVDDETSTGEDTTKEKSPSGSSKNIVHGVSVINVEVTGEDTSVLDHDSGVVKVHPPSDTSSLRSGPLSQSRTWFERK